MKKNNLGLILILTVLLSFISGAIGAYLIIESTPAVKNTIIKNNNITLDEENSISSGVSNVYDAVVVVEGFSKNTLVSTGTGFIYKQANGTSYIMTNHHVISDAESVKVILSDNTIIDAEVKGSEAYSDIAVLAVSSDKAKGIATMGDSSKLRVGDSVFAIGSPEGSDYAGTVTKGIISGRDRLVAVALTNSTTSDYYMKVLQTDAAINPGNSGGPLCNINGEVIGITNMKLVDSTVEGMGFAIPIEDALYYSAILEKGEDIVRPYIGIGMLDITDSYYLWKNGITIDGNIDEGIVVMEVAENSPASKAKLQKGDVIVAINDEDIASIAEFRYELYKHSPNEEIKITYIRNNKTKTTTVKLTENKSS